jgi:hypothetical protein
MAPYVHLNIRDHDSLPVFSRWAFPIARILGSLITANMVQFIIQIRVIEIIRHRIVFIRLQKRIYELSESTRKNLMENVRWDAKYSSEECIWSLDKYLKRYSDESYQHLTNVLGNEMHNQSLTASALRWTAIISIQVALFGGLILSVVGYIGCFSLVQNSGNRTTGPLIWLLLEVLLSLTRMLLWAWDPEWDESAGMKFDLQLKPGAPLITCHKDPEEIDEERVLPLTRDTVFLSEVTSHTGLLERVDDDRITLYYSLTGDKIGRRLLYIVICDYKEGISRVYVNRGATSQFSSSEMIDKAEGTSTASSISSHQTAPEQSLSSGSIQVDDEDGSVSATLKDGFAKAETNPFTENKDFMEKLKRHYNSILDLLANTNKRRGALSSSLSIPNASSIPRDWRVEGLKPKRSEKTKETDGHGIKGRDPVGKMSDLTDLDRKYQRVGLIEWQRKCLCQERHMWAGEYAKLVRSEALSDLQRLPLESSPREVQMEGETIESPADLARRVEAEEVEFVLMEEIGEVERMLVEETLELERLLLTEYADLVSNLGAKKPKNIERDRRKRAIIRIRSERNQVELRLDHEKKAGQDGLKKGGFERSKWEDARADMDKEILKEWKLLQDQVENTSRGDLSEASEPKGDAKPIQAWVKTDHFYDMKRLSERLQTASVKMTEQLKTSTDRMNERFKKIRGGREDGLEVPLIRTFFERSKVRRERMKVRLLDERKEMELRLLSISERQPLPQYLGSQVLARLALGTRSNYVNIRAECEQILKDHPHALRRQPQAVKDHPESEAAIRAIAPLVIRALARSRAVAVIDFLSFDVRLATELLTSAVNIQSAATLDGVPTLSPTESRPAMNKLSIVGLHPSELQTAEDDVEYLSKLKGWVSGSLRVLSLDLWGKDKTDAFAPVGQALAANRKRAVGQPIVKYKFVHVTDYYRRGNPYLLFGYPGVSECIAFFSATSTEKLRLRLEHCCTMAIGKIDITVNGVRLADKNSNFPIYNFGITEIPIDSKLLKITSDEDNELCIVLQKGSPGVYWLSEIQVLDASERNLLHLED